MPEPEKKFSQGNCQASILRNKIKHSGKTITARNVIIQKSYLNKEGNWQNSNSFSQNDLPKLILCAVKNYDYLTARKEEKHT